MPLDRTQLSLLRWVDGSQTIGEILSEASSERGLATMDQDFREQYARLLFQSLWQLDFLALGLTTEAPKGALIKSHEGS